MKITVYIAGKITGEDYQKCFDKFQAAEETLTQFGYQVVNPMKVVKKGTSWQEAMEICKPHILNSNVVYFLKDWRDSEGAQLERHWCNKHNIRIVDYDNLPKELLSEASQV